MDKTIICPGCGWTGTIEMLGYWGDCPECDYENNLEPNRLCTLLEMLERGGVYDGVQMDLFLKSLFKFLGYPGNQNEWSTCVLVQLRDEFLEAK